LPALVLLRKPLFGLAKRHIQPERYVQFALKLVENYDKNTVDKMTWIGIIKIENKLWI
jgi:hypothetical protein